MYILKYLLADIINFAYPDDTVVASGPEGTSFPTGPNYRGEGLVNDGVYVYHVDRADTDNGIRRIKMSNMGSELAVVPSDGDDNNSSDPYAPDNFFQDSFNDRGTFATYVAMESTPPGPSAPSSFGNVMW